MQTLMNVLRELNGVHITAIIVQEATLAVVGLGINCLKIVIPALVSNKSINK